jgi:hypothetical protein
VMRLGDKSRIAVGLARRKSNDRTKSQLRGVARRAGWLVPFAEWWTAQRQLLHGAIGPRTWRFGVTGGD